MRISLIHSTVYRYSAPIVLEPHLFRLRPREDGTQRLIRHDLEITPQPSGRSTLLDQNGNTVIQAWFAGAFSELAVRSSFEVETLRENPFDFLLPAETVLALPPSYSDLERSALAPYMEASDGVADYSRSLAAKASGQTMPFLEVLVRALFESCTHVIRPEGAPQPAAQTLRERIGSCRDLTVLFCAASRAVGIPSRFVSGYECLDRPGADNHLHAWAEVYIPGGGWRGYDPSRGLAVSTTHVALATAGDPALAAPVAGSYRGAANSQMEFAISMQLVS